MSLVLMTTFTYGQLKNEDLAINKFKVEKKLKCIADDPVNKAVLDMDLKTSIVTTFKTGKVLWYIVMF